MFREVLVVERRRLGPDHPGTLTTTGNLAKTLLRQGQHASARDMFEDMVARQRRVLGPAHPDTLSTTCDLASLFVYIYIFPICLIAYHIFVYMR